MNRRRAISTPEKIEKSSACPKCFRPLDQCICAKAIPYDNTTRILILQHPREQYKLLNSAMLSHCALKNSTIKIGLSWRNLNQALGEETDAKQWGVLYLKGIIDPSRKIELFDSRQNRLLPMSTKFKGIVVLDGSWKQAKSMWWRNPWVLKLTRITLNPEHKSQRGQAKKEGQATIEAIAMALDCLGENPEICAGLRKQFEELIIRPNSPTPSRNF